MADTDAQRPAVAVVARLAPAEDGRSVGLHTCPVVPAVLFYDVELWHLDDEPELSWSAEGAIIGDSSGARFESADTLAELVADVVNEVREISQTRGGTR
jgi:hypothetical protein